MAGNDARSVLCSDNVLIYRSRCLPANYDSVYVDFSETLLQIKAIGFDGKDVLFISKGERFFDRLCQLVLNRASNG